MRDPKRIKRICKLLEECWNYYPDERLGQFLMNYVFGNINGKYTGYIFYREDDQNEQSFINFKAMMDEECSKTK